MAIVSTVAVGEYLAALVIVYASGGEALEDYAAGRAKRNSPHCWRERLRLGT